MANFIIYCRVSTREQGDSGLGLDAQLNSCRKYVESQSGEILGEFSDVKSGSSKNRAGLNKALSLARARGATIVFSKLDRLARDAEYAHAIRNSGVPLYFCDFPQINSLLFGILVAVAQYEKELGQGRTKDALNAIKREIQLTGNHISKKGNAINRLGRKTGAPGVSTSSAISASFHDKINTDQNRRRQWLSMQEMSARGVSTTQIAETLNALTDRTPRGGLWTRGQVHVAMNTWGKYFINLDNK